MDMHGEDEWQVWLNYFHPERMRKARPVQYAFRKNPVNKNVWKYPTYQNT